jgi:8-oxo-dGTP pyrophosphatase MutT (NUDIX family)
MAISLALAVILIGGGKMIIKPVKIDNAEFQKRVADYFQERIYRPTCVGMLYAGKKILLVNSTRGDSWAFPQGGIRRGDDMFEALAEEIWEELEIDMGSGPEKLNDVKTFSETHFICHYVHSNRRTEKNPPDTAIGKAYFAAAAEFCGDPKKIKCKLDEVKRVGFFDLGEAENLIRNHNSQEKVRITIEIINTFKHLLR